MNIQEIYNHFLSCTGISTDTRKIDQGTMFFALKGANFNGNEFAKDALEKGASYAVIDEEKYKVSEKYILVEDVLTALQQLANFHRRTLNIPIIGITGSNGKTTSKELINAVLGKKFKTYATKGNLNNHIGIPLTLLAMTKEIEIGIVEMGANHQKEIEGYCKVAEPNYGMITNIGKAHLEGFGGPEGVKKGKGELYDYLLQTNGVAFINSKNEILKTMNKFSSPIMYPDEKDFYHCQYLDSAPFVRIKAEDGEIVSTQLIGKYNFENIAAALCIGKYFKVPSSDANAAVASYVPSNNRSQMVQRGTNEIILDAYNANPSSVKAAVENFVQIKKEKKVIILGDMFELGNDSRKEHESVGRLLSSLNVNGIILVGKEMKAAKDFCHHANYFPDKKLLEEYLTKNRFSNTEILIKGSRGMGLETLLEFI
jgi:UDP-N-acetylmuramoyl-tripeptide--D-alanyl-D-alanine ligase